MDRSQHTLTKCRSDEKLDGTIDKEMVKRLGCKKDKLLEVELVKSEIEHKEPLFAGFFFSCNL